MAAFGLAMSAMGTKVGGEGDCGHVCQLFGIASLDSFGNLFQTNVLMFK